MFLPINFTPVIWFLDLDYEIRMNGIHHLNSHPELYMEYVSNESWETYGKEMSKSGTWSNNVVMQAVANAYNCIIHMTQSDFNFTDATVITPVVCYKMSKILFIGYVNNIHYVSTVSNQKCENSKIRYLKRKLEHIPKTSNNKRLTLEEPGCGKLNSQNEISRKQQRLADSGLRYKVRCSKETTQQKQDRLPTLAKVQCV